MSYYDNNGQWSAPGQNNWEHQTTAARTGESSRSDGAPGIGAAVGERLMGSSAGATGPQPQDEFAFFYQFDEVDKAFDNLSKSGKAYGMPPRHGRANNPGGSRPHSITNFDDSRGPPAGLQNFYANQRHNSSRGSNEAEQVMQAKRRMAAQRERDLRNLHTEQQYQRTVLSESTYNNKAMSEEETRQLIARQRSALYGEGPFAEKSGYVDEVGNVRPGVPGPSTTSSIRGHSPLAFDASRGSVPPAEGEASTPRSVGDAPHGASAGPVGEVSSRPTSTASPQPNPAAGKSVFDGPAGQVSRTSTSSPGDVSAKQDLGGPKAGQQNPSVAPIGTRPSGAPAGAAAASSAKRSTTPLASPGGWGRGSNSVWGQSSGLGAQASVWG